MPISGEILYVKSTEEPVTFLRARKVHFYDSLGLQLNGASGQVYIVRRPIVSDIKGISYKFAHFLAEELETSEEQTARLFAKVKSRQAIAMGEYQEPMEMPFPTKKPS